LLTLDLVTLAQPLSLKAFCDADWASDIDVRRSTSGVSIFIGPNLVYWWSHEQRVSALSSTVEVWLKLLLNEHGFLLCSLNCKFHLLLLFSLSSRWGVRVNNYILSLLMLLLLQRLSGTAVS